MPLDTLDIGSKLTVPKILRGQHHIELLVLRELTGNEERTCRDSPGRGERSRKMKCSVDVISGRRSAGGSC